MVAYIVYCTWLPPEGQQTKAVLNATVLLSLPQVNVSKDLIMLEVFDEHRLVSGVTVAAYTFTT